MMPGNVLSSVALPSAFLPPRDTPKNDPLVDLTLGGVNFDDGSQGMRAKVWTAQVDGSGNVVVSASAVAPQIIITDPSITWIGLAFDTNMKVFLTYLNAVGAFYRWFDSTISAFSTNQLPVGSSLPFCQLDDARPLQTQKSDILLHYVRNNRLLMRMQRDRYGVEYDLDDVTGLTLRQTGMNRTNRFQFEF